MTKSNTFFGGDFKQIFENRMKTFWGYGSLKGDIWFVGMEEGCGEDIRVLMNRLIETKDKDVLDIQRDFTSDPDHNAWFKEGAPLQSTYNWAIYLLLYLETGRVSTREERRSYQINSFGRKNSKHAVLELMPLPAKSVKGSDWVYAESGIPELASRKTYLDTYKEQRVKALKKLIGKYHPKMVVFTSLTYISDWQSIADVPFWEVIPKKLYIAKNHDTLYVVVPHAVARGLSNKSREEIASAIASY